MSKADKAAFQRAHPKTYANTTGESPVFQRLSNTVIQLETEAGSPAINISPEKGEALILIVDDAEQAAILIEKLQDAIA